MSGDRNHVRGSSKDLMFNPSDQTQMKRLKKVLTLKNFQLPSNSNPPNSKYTSFFKKISQMLTLKNFQLPSNSIFSDFHQTLSAATNCNWKILDAPTLYFWGNFSQFHFYLRSLSRCWQDKVEAANMPGLISRKCGQRYKLCPPA